MSYLITALSKPDSDTPIVAATSSVTAFVLGSVVFLIFGYICGYKYKRNRTPQPHLIEATQPVQMYEEILQLQAESPVRDKDVKLNENVAYDSVHP